MKSRSPTVGAIKNLFKLLGITMAVPFFIWAPLGLIPSIPSIIDVFGIDGLKLPTGIVIGGLMLAAVGYEDF